MLRFKAFACSLFIVFLVMVSPIQGMASPTPKGLPGSDIGEWLQPSGNGSENNLDFIWDNRNSELKMLLAEAEQLQQKAESLAQPLLEAMRRTRIRLARLSGLYHASQGHPSEQITVVQQMHGLRNALVHLLEPVKDIGTTIDRRLMETARLQTELRELRETGNGGDDLPDEVRAYAATVDEARNTLQGASTRLRGILDPAEAARAQIENVLSDVEGSLVGNWETYYLTPYGTRFNDIASIPSLLTDWARSLGSRIGFAYPHTQVEWLVAAVNFVVSLALMAAVGFMLLRGARTLPECWKRAAEESVKTSWVRISLGLAVLVASGNRSGGVYFAFLLLGSLILISGIASLSWRLRVAVVEELELKPSPLKRLYLPAALGVIILFSDLPTLILGLIWGLSMLGFLVYIFLSNREQPDGDVLPLPERISTNSAPVFAIASILFIVAGYARLAILAFMLLFALVNILTLGSALMGLFSIITDRLLNQEKRPIFHAVVQAFSVPVAWIVSLVCALPWLWAVPGAQYLLGHFMRTNYRVGIASFDFGRVALIVLLFFLVRSLISLGGTYLEHLPSRLPQLERGVIPPLRSMFFYGMWALFGIIGLSLLGMNFTSLAVVAGGLSVGIGFGMQNLFNNLISGIILIFGRTLLVGDYVEVSGAAGTVTGITIRSTTLRTPDRAIVYVPNSAIISAQFTNWTRSGRMVRKQIQVGIAYGTNTELVETLMLQAASSQSHVVGNPKPTVFFMDFGENALQFTLDIFVDDFSFGLSTQSAVRYEIDRLFREHGIETSSTPQVEVRMPRQESSQNPDGNISAKPEAGTPAET